MDDAGVQTSAASGADAGAAAEAYEVQAHPLRLRPGLDLDRALHLAVELEDEERIPQHGERGPRP